MLKFKWNALIIQCIIIGCVCLGVCGTSDSSEQQVRFMGDILQWRRAPVYEFFIKHNLNELNITLALTELLTKSHDLGFKFANEWENIQRSAELTAVDTRCVQQIGALVVGLADGQLTSYKYLDSWGKIPAGLLKGHIKEYGNFDECVDLKKAMPNEAQIIGKYCLAQVPVGQLMTSLPAAQFLNIELGVCMPASCSAKEFDVFYKLLLQKVLGLNLEGNATLVRENACSLREKAPLEGWAVVAVVVLSILTFGLFFSSLYEYFAKLAGKKPNPILSSFSVPTNMKQLLLVKPNVKSPNVIPCLNGIRCISLIWIFFGHITFFYFTMPHINLTDVFEWSKGEFAQVLQKAPFAVDTFFFLSGFLVAFIALKDMDRSNGKLNIGMMYVHRVIRLMPMVALAILVYTTLLPQMSNAPYWPFQSRVNDICKDTWWSTLLFVQNYVHPKNYCISHSWYLAVDMQLYFFAPFALLILWKWQRKGFAVIAIIGLLFVVCLFTTFMLNDYTYHNKGIFFPSSNTFQKTYFATQARTSPWFIGILFGYYMHKTKGTRVGLSKFAVLLGWLTAFAIFASLLFGLYPKTIHREETTTLEEALYWTLGRTAWPVGLAWVVFACVNDYAGPINSFLSCPLWQPFARLSYCIYIWHMLLIQFNEGRVKASTYFSTYDMVLEFWGDFGWSLLLATYMHLAFEAPLLNLEKELLPKPNKPKTASKEDLILPKDSAGEAPIGVVQSVQTESKEETADVKINANEG